MDMLKQLIIDSFNGFSPSFIPLFLLQLLVAGLIGHLTQKVVNIKYKSEILNNGGLIALGVTLLTSLVKYSLPFSVIGAATLLLLFAKTKDKSGIQIFGLFLFTLAGLGCGVGSIVQTAIGFLILFVVVFFTPVKFQND